jgi:hypothetical protein
MVTLRSSGNISAEATTQFGNIPPEAMRGSGAAAAGRGRPQVEPSARNPIMRAEADRCRDNDVEAISRPGQLLHRGLQLPGLSFKVRHDVEVVVAAEHGKPVL